MDYAAARTPKLQIRSSAIASAIRQVINLRVKSSATYCLRKNPEAMIRRWASASLDQGRQI